MRLTMGMLFWSFVFFFFDLVIFCALFDLSMLDGRMYLLCLLVCHVRNIWFLSRGMENGRILSLDWER